MTSSHTHKLSLIAATVAFAAVAASPALATDAAPRNGEERTAAATPEDDPIVAPVKRMAPVMPENRALREKSQKAKASADAKKTSDKR